MTLGEELIELRENILRDKSDLVAGESDFLWADETLLRYIKDGERRFARQTLCLRDSTTPEVTQIKLRTGVQIYPLHRSVIGVLSARYDTDTTDIARTGHGIVSSARSAESHLWDPSSSATTQPGRPIGYYTDETLVFARQARPTLSIFPLSSATEDGKILYLRTIRIPMTTYSLDTLDEESEIPEDYQLDCLEWAAYRAQRHFDADAGAAVPADKHKLAFDGAVADAINSLKRTMHANTTMGYGTLGTNYER